MSIHEDTTLVDNSYDVTPELNVPDTFEPGFHGLSIRDRIIGSRAGAAITALATSFGIGGASQLSFSASAEASPKLLTPQNMVKATSRYVEYKILLNPDDEFNLTHESLYPHELQRDGACPPHAPHSTLAVYDRLTTRGYYTLDCMIGSNGKRMDFFAPIKNLPLTPTAQHMNFKPLLQELGDSAANSDGIQPTAHGKPSHITINYNRQNGTKDATVYYYRDAKSAGIAKSLKTLRLISKTKQGDTTVTAVKTWY